MKVKLFNGKVQTFALDVLGGGFDQDSGKMQLIVRDAAGLASGTITLDVIEGMRVAHLLTATAPKVERVEVERASSASPNAGEGVVTGRISSNRPATEERS